MSQDEKGSLKMVNNMDEAYILAGGNGRYQILAFISSYFSIFTFMCFSYAIPYFLIIPELECHAENGWRSCTQEEACRLKTYRYDAPKDFNFMTEFDLLCSSELSSIIASAYFFGSVFSCLLIGTLSDLFGRIPMLIAGNLGNIITLIILIMFPSYTMVMAMSAINGFMTVSNNSNSYTFCYDSSESKYSTFNGVAVSVAWGVGEVLIACAMWTGINWRAACIVLMLVSETFFIFLIWVRESPRYYYSMKKYDLALQRLRYVARINGKSIDDVRLVPVNENETNETITFKEIVWSLCCMPKLTIKVILFTICFCTSTLLFYGVSLNIEKMVGSTYINGLVIAFSLIVSCLVCGLIMDVVGKKLSLGMYFLMTGIAVFLQGFFWENRIASLVFAIVNKFGASAADTSLYIYVAELYPTSVKGVAFGIGVFFSRMASMLSTPLSLLGTLPMCCILAILSISAGCICLFLPVKTGAVIEDTLVNQRSTEQTQDQTVTSQTCLKKIYCFM